ncbi:MAG TPA: adenylate/guanylate cyclase domain-containing protein [Syntrophales bacterium]|nr:adenylate/guanylate cyclase domain-containing protein [Syntrophales bacterium]
MISVEEALIDTITATFHRLRTGAVPEPIPIPDDLPDNEIRQLLTYVNRFLVEFDLFSKSMTVISRGELADLPVAGRMAVAHSLKALQSNLKHLTWKTQQIASGNLEQQVDFMGDFSVAFNTMTRQLKESREQLVELNQQLEQRNRFIRETFGRYTSDEIVGVLLDMPEGLKLGGEKREVTVLMSDLRGFTALAERLEATTVVALLNHYLSAMVEVIHQFGGTIDEIIGDAICVLFGAPVAVPDAARRAACCALAMQRAMEEVNSHNIQMDWPELEMGIAVHTGDAVVGNIGSTKRSKYGVVGRTINLTARIESFTVGGQVLVSPAAINAAGEGLILGNEVEVHAKGMREAMVCRELMGHEEQPELMLAQNAGSLTALAHPIPFSCLCLTEKHLEGKVQCGTMLSLSSKQAVIKVDCPFQPYANIMLQLEGTTSDEDRELYAKVLHPLDHSSGRYLVHFTSVPPTVKERLQQLIAGT